VERLYLRWELYMLSNIGKWKIIALETGDFRLDGGAMMGSVPKVLWEKTNPADKLNRIDLSLRCLFLDDGENKVLIETGMGDKLSPEFFEMFHVVQSKHPIKNKLADIGYQMEDITHVILTHLHFDHAGGATTLDNSGNLIPAFPDAEYYVSKENWNAGINPSPRDSASYLDLNYLPLKKTAKLHLLPENSEIFNGLSTITVNGHTNGQQLIKIESDNDTLIFCSDLIPLRSHLRLPWIMGYDLNAVLTLEEKTRFLKQAAIDNWWLWFYHDPKTVAVRIKEGKQYYDVVEEVMRNGKN